MPPSTHPEELCTKCGAPLIEAPHGMDCFDCAFGRAAGGRMNYARMLQIAKIAYDEYWRDPLLPLAMDSAINKAQNVHGRLTVAECEWVRDRIRSRSNLDAAAVELAVSDAMGAALAACNRVAIEWAGNASRALLRGDLETATSMASAAQATLTTKTPKMPDDLPNKNPKTKK